LFPNKKYTMASRQMKPRTLPMTIPAISASLRPLESSDTQFAKYIADDGLIELQTTPPIPYFLKLNPGGLMIPRLADVKFCAVNSFWTLSTIAELALGKLSAADTAKAYKFSLSGAVKVTVRVPSLPSTPTEVTGPAAGAVYGEVHVPFLYWVQSLSVLA